METQGNNHKRVLQHESSPRRVAPKTTAVVSPANERVPTQQTTDPMLSGEEQSNNELIFPTSVAGFDLSDVPPLKEIPGLNVTGVGVLPYTNKWRATCVIDGKSVVLGDYDDSRVAAWVHHAVFTKHNQSNEARGFVEERPEDESKTRPQEEVRPVLDKKSPLVKEEVIKALDAKDEDTSKSEFKNEEAPRSGDEDEDYEDYCETLTPESQEKRSKAGKRNQAQPATSSRIKKIASPVQRILDHCKALELQTGSPDIRRTTITNLCECQHKTFLKTITTMKMRQRLITYDKNFIRLTDKGRKRANSKNASVLDNASLQAHLKKRYKLRKKSALLFDLLCDGRVHNRAAALAHIGTTNQETLVATMSSMKRKGILDYNPSTVWLTDVCFFDRPREKNGDQTNTITVV